MEFVKMHGIGNDFVVLDGVQTPLPETFNFSAFAQHACARHFGIGADGLLLLSCGDVSPVRMRMWNPDGSEDFCGNGLRCVAWLAFNRGYVGEAFACDTLAGVRQCAIVGDGRVRVSMGTPSFEPSQIPILYASPRAYELRVGGEVLPAVSLSTGSTHTVLFVSELPDDARFFELSPLIEDHALFPERTSVMWAKRDENGLQLRIWERGAGETLACGTGACASAVAAILRGATSPVSVRSKGGALQIAWNGGEITMTGEAREVFAGRMI